MSAAARPARRPFALLNGGAPSFAEPLHVGRPNVPRREDFLRRLAGALDSRWLSNHGPLVRELEERVAAEAGTGHAVTVCNATLAIQALLRALDVSGEVVMPAFTFVATAHAAEWEGLPPRFADVDPVTHHLDPASAARVMGDGAGAVLAVHLWGRPCDGDALEALGARRGIPVLYDAAHAFGSRGPRGPVGGGGVAEVFSFHATKFLNSFEGGCIVTDDGALASRLRRILNFGFTGYDRIESLGINGKMSEPCAAMALCGLDALPELLEANRRAHARYRAGLSGIPGLRVLGFDDVPGANHQYVVLEVDAAAFGLDRDALHALLWEENVRARRYFFPGLHRVPPYAGRPLALPGGLPVTERLAATVLVLPAGAAVEDASIDGVCDLVRDARGAAEEIAAAIAARGRRS